MGFWSVRDNYRRDRIYFLFTMKRIASPEAGWRMDHQYATHFITILDVIDFSPMVSEESEQGVFRTDVLI